MILCKLETVALALLLLGTLATAAGYLTRSLAIAHDKPLEALALRLRTRLTKKRRDFR